MGAVLAWGVGFGMVLYICKMGSFLLLPHWVQRVFHYNNFTMFIMDLGLGYVAGHVVSIAGGYIGLAVMVTFGFCSITYIFTRKGVLAIKDWWEETFD